MNHSGSIHLFSDRTHRLSKRSPSIGKNSGSERILVPMAKEAAKIIIFVGLVSVASILVFHRASAAEIGLEHKMASSLENLRKEQVVPDVIDTVPAMAIEITYPLKMTVEPGKVIPLMFLAYKPKFAYKAEPDTLYTLAMVDPDAPSRAEPSLREILHYIAVNVPGNDVSKGETLAEYIGPKPPKGSGLHRYVFLLFKQSGPLKSNMKIPAGDIEGRKNFSIRKFAKEYNLGEPVAANFFQAEYAEPQVAHLHEQPTKN